MDCVRSFLLVAGLLAVAAPLRAQSAVQRPVTIAPFEPVRVRLPPPLNDASFAAFRQMLAGVAQRRLFAELAGYVSPQGFFWDRDSANRFDPKRTGAENLAAALGLSDGSGIGWRMLADFAAEPTASARASTPGVVCSPAKADFDQEDLDGLIDATHFSRDNWFYLRGEGVELRLAPHAESAVIETLGSYFVRVLRSVTARANAEPLRTSWTRIAAPSGKVGFAAPDTLMSLSAARLCYAKDVTDRWSVVGFIGGGD
jgi:hypothetical protein